MTRFAVVAHAGGSLGGGLTELREVLRAEGVVDPLWYEVDDVRVVTDRAREACDRGAEVVLVWGGDGTVRRCIAALLGTPASLAILPAGTGNELAFNLGIPMDLRGAVQVGVHGEARRLDAGRLNGDYFGLMAGAGFDALVMRDADAGLKGRFGRAAYLWSGLLNLDAPTVATSVTVDGQPFFRGELSCVLVGNVGKLFRGVQVFEEARPDDGILELIVFTARNRVEWTRTISRVTFGSAEDSPFVEATRGTRFEVHFERPFLYELDGDPQKDARRLRVGVHAASIAVRLPPVRR